MLRSRRLRTTSALRDLVRETVLTPNDFIQPFFAVEGRQREEPVNAMPGVSRYSVDLLPAAVERYAAAGGKAVLLFGLPAEKDSRASQAYAADGVVQRAVQAIKKQWPQMIVITDVCLCEYMDHGHCGIVENGRVDNDKTLPLLARTAVSHARAGADIVAPSDMMDFRVREIRAGLDKAGFTDTAILSYAVKYASAFYGPFREAADSAPSFGDRRSYQMDPANGREAVKEARLDVEEGADMLMVKPAVPYLDVVRALKKRFDLPLAAYHVSGEYAMIKAAAQQGWIAEKEIVLETMTSIKRAGADLIVTYYAEELLEWVK